MRLLAVALVFAASASAHAQSSDRSCGDSMPLPREASVEALREFSVSHVFDIDDDEPHTPLGKTMHEIGGLYKGIANALKDASTDGPERDDKLAIDAGKLVDLFETAAGQVPATAATDAARTDYAAKIRDEKALAQKIQAALTERRDDDARAIAATMGVQATAGHRAYRPRH